MLGKAFSFLFGTKNDRELRRMSKIVQQTNLLETEYKELSNEELSAQTQKLRALLQQGETVDSLLPRAFAVAREASHRIMEMRHFDCQLIGGIVLHEGKIAEMRTGEGKTLVATLPAYLNALTGQGVHVVTVNDYLARRDAEWMRPLYEFLGLSVGIVTSRQPMDEKKKAYACDITYCTNNELGFDYLRDNMVYRLEDKAQRGTAYAIIDEVDSILIDEARTPLIISGPSEESSELYKQINLLIPNLKRAVEIESDSVKPEYDGHFLVDEKQRQIELTEQGHEITEKLLYENKLLAEGETLYAANNLNLLHHVHAALKAHHLFRKDDQYIVQNGQIIIVDEHTGRLMPGRRWSEGIHQAIEAKEGLSVQQENQTHASTTFQNYFRLYSKLSGMTGTADTEAFEFRQIYGLDVLVIPTNKPMIRKDHNDLIYLSMNEKYDAIVKEINQESALGRPVLVGTASIESSELLSKRLEQEKIQHQVLNAKFHEKEAEIIAQAGQPGAITIATNMAGRGTDIMLGGNYKSQIAQGNDLTEQQILEIKQQWKENHQKVIDAGGLHILSAERHESRRIDNQLRGRAGRQGDPGSSRFFLSIEDHLMRIFATDRMRSFMQNLGMEKGEAIENRLVTRSIENAQRKVESRNFDIRKSLLEYDDVANKQRLAIYHQRDEVLAAENLAEDIEKLYDEVVEELVDDYLPPNTPYIQWNIKGLENVLSDEFRIDFPITPLAIEQKK
ncbi:MAG: preprotein translocase subunit SecA, partial [Pseudomonadota bacterium]